MSILIELAIGAGIGAVVAYVLRSDTFGAAILAGMVGAVIFGTAYSLFSAAPSADNLISLGGLLMAVLGALVGVILWRGVRHFMHRLR